MACLHIIVLLNELNRLLFNNQQKTTKTYKQGEDCSLTINKKTDKNMEARRFKYAICIKCIHVIQYMRINGNNTNKSLLYVYIIH